MPLTSLLTAIALQSFQPESQTRLIVSEYMAQQPVVGVSVAVMQGGKLVFGEGFGWENREEGREATAHTRFRLASISKPITATGVMALVEEGKLDLDADIRNYVPEWPEKEHTVTLRQILTHSSGIRHYTGGNEGTFSKHVSTSEAVKLFADSDLLFEPWTSVSYSTHAFTVAARAIETASGMNFGDYMRAAVWSPAGVTDLGLENLTQPKPKNRSQIYNRVGDSFTVAYSSYQDNSWKYGGGGMESSAISLVQWANAVMEGEVVSPETVEEMWTPQTVGNGARGYALGWAVRSESPLQVSHGGSQQGSRTHLFVDVETKTVVAVLSNTSGNPIGEIDSKIFNLWVDYANSQPSGLRAFTLTR